MAKLVEYFYIITIKVGNQTHSFSGVALVSFSSGVEISQYGIYQMLMAEKVLPYISVQNYSVIFYYVKENN